MSLGFIAIFSNNSGILFLLLFFHVIPQALKIYIICLNNYMKILESQIIVQELHFSLNYIKKIFSFMWLHNFTLKTWAEGLASQLKYDSNKSASSNLDFKNSGSAYAGPFVLYFCYGLLDAMFQTLCYWTIGALADDSQTLSRYSGFYKGVQSAGAALAWQTEKEDVFINDHLKPFSQNGFPKLRHFVRMGFQCKLSAWYFHFC